MCRGEGAASPDGLACPASYFVPSTLYFVLRWRSHRLGGMTERTKVAVLKTAVGFTPYRGFESHSLRRPPCHTWPDPKPNEQNIRPHGKGTLVFATSTARVAGLGHGGIAGLGRSSVDSLEHICERRLGVCNTSPSFVQHRWSDLYRRFRNQVGVEFGCFDPVVPGS